jgi:putative hemolysin
MERLFLPVITVLQWVAGLFTRALGSPRQPRLLLGEEELRTLISLSRETGVVEHHEAEMLHKVLAFGDRPVREVMVPRTDIIFIEDGTTLSQFLAVYAQYSHTRFPVYKDEIDNVLGTVHTKDILSGLAQGTLQSQSVVTKLAREPYFVPESKTIDKLLQEMRTHRVTMAMVVDEFGGIAGLVTLKQIIEEVMGAVGDEHVVEEEPIRQIDERTVQVDAGMRIDEFNAALGVSLPKGEYETVAGFLLARLGHIPQEGETLHYPGLRFVVGKMRGVKVEHLLVRKE